MKQIVRLRELRIRALREMISRDMVYLVIRFIYIYEPRRILYDVASVAVARLLEDLIYQPHITWAVKIKYLTESYKMAHKQIRDKVLQLFYSYILSKIERLTSQMEESAITLLDMITDYKINRKS